MNDDSFRNHLVSLDLSQKGEFHCKTSHTHENHSQDGVFAHCRTPLSVKADRWSSLEEISFESI